jgi:nitrogen regulatory protein PII-like uncharacterized protein
MNTAACTLFEGNYDYGVAALINSLNHYGFKGIFYVGYRGNLPFWAKIKAEDDEIVYSINENISVKFIKIKTKYHFTNYKAHFMLDLFEKFGQDFESLIYIDPDIIIQEKWTFFEDWVKNGIAVCGDINSDLPDCHPIRLKWEKYAIEKGYKKFRNLNMFFNGGFMGVDKSFINSLHIWKELMDKSIEDGHTDISAGWFKKTGWSNLFSATEDQDLMNLMLMLTADPVSYIGPDGMGFQRGRTLMYHAVGSPKPWNSSFVVKGLKGKKINMNEKQFFKFCQNPISIYSPNELRLKRISIFINTLLTKFINNQI